MVRSMVDRTPTREHLAEAVARLAELAADQANESEAQRRLGPDVVQAMVDAGFARYFVPSTWGGDADEARFGDLLDAVVAVGEACPSTAWVASLTAGLGRMAAFLPADGQAEVWSDGPDPLIVGALMPLGRAEPASGGWQLAGRWPFVSAIEHSEWALVCGTAATDKGPEARFFAVPRAAYAIEDTWFNVGMRATGSNTLVLGERFVAPTHSFTRDDLAAGRPVGSAAPCHTVPLRAANGLSFATPVLGAARGALRSWSGYVATKPDRAGMSAPGSDRAGHQQTLARSSGEIDAAELLLRRASTVADQGTVAPPDVARNTRDCALAVDLLVTAVDRLFRAAGSTGQLATNALQRFWRDVNVAASHVVLRFEPAAAMYAQQHLAP
jgi:alkylation response protein AidB-like acyl-CoA dehydrogenase